MSSLNWSAVRTALQSVGSAHLLSTQMAACGSYTDAIRLLIFHELDHRLPSHLAKLPINLDQGLYDLEACAKTDPALHGHGFSCAIPLLFYKGFKASQAYRLSHSLWNSNIPESKIAALAIQSRCSQVWSVDIHPAAQIGQGIVIDHGTGVVIGETAKIGAKCVIYHGVTLGGTGNQSGDRHPKIGDNVTIGCNAVLLGNISIGPFTRVGAGGVVTRSWPGHLTLVGNPAAPVGQRSKL